MLGKWKKGHIPWNKGKSFRKERICPTCGENFFPKRKKTIYCSRKCIFLSPIYRKKQSEKLKGRIIGYKWPKGHPTYTPHHSEATKKKMSETQKRIGTVPPSHPFPRGEKHPSWKGGISFEPYTTDWTETLRRSIRERDNYICQLCSQYGNYIHHLDYDKKNCNPTNLITLCHSCHSTTNHNRNYWINYFKNHL